MVHSSATTVEQYLQELEPSRREAICAVREVILKNLPKGYTETMQYGMIGYVVPHSIYPDGYHCNPDDPLPYINLGSQKNHMAVYMMSVYSDKKVEKKLRDGFKKAEKKLNMGKSCVRFKKIEDLPLNVIGDVVGSLSVKDCIAMYEKLAKKRKK